MSGTTDAPSFKIDKDAARENRKEEIAQEKQNVKALLKEEFGLFKRDSGVGAYKETKTTAAAGSTQVEWSEFDDAKSETELKTESPKKKVEPSTSTTDKPTKKVPKWLEEKK
jgi:hypothetical protein